MYIEPRKSLKGTILVPGDKSISHRSIMFGAIADGMTEANHFLPSADCLSTISCFQKMGVEIERTNDHVLIHGKGLHGLKEPASVLDAGNSGTTTRLISGILAGQSFSSELTGDASIQKRPMGRILTPLKQMNANIYSKNQNDCAPLCIEPSHLHGIHYESPVASAQVKSCILLAGLFADAPTTVTEPTLSRNHTELMLQGFGVKLEAKGKTCTIFPEQHLHGQHIEIPGDISSAAYFIAAGLLVKDSELLIKNVGINPTRAGILKIVKAMGASIEEQNVRFVSGEPVCDLYVTTCEKLHATEISGEDIPTLAVMAATAEGTTVIKDAKELKVKESDRILSVVKNLNAIGVDATATEDGMIIHGGEIKGGTVDCVADHRIAMSFAIAGLASKEGVTLKGGECVNISYPMFYEDLAKL